MIALVKREKKQALVTVLKATSPPLKLKDFGRLFRIRVDPRRCCRGDSGEKVRRQDKSLPSMALSGDILQAWPTCDLHPTSEFVTSSSVAFSASKDR